MLPTEFEFILHVNKTEQQISKSKFLENFHQHLKSPSRCYYSAHDTSYIKSLNFIAIFVFIHKEQTFFFFEGHMNTKLKNTNNIQNYKNS